MTNRFVYLPHLDKAGNTVTDQLTAQPPKSVSQPHKKYHTSSKVHYFQLWQCARDATQHDGVVVLAREKKVVSSLTVEEQLAQQDLYKTELCRSFVETGRCRYGKKCRFAHGIDELRPVLRHPKYKTQICACFYNTGFCPYGMR